MTNANAANFREIISEAEYNSLIETFYLISIPGMKDRLEEGIDATIDDCMDFEF